MWELQTCLFSPDWHSNKLAAATDMLYSFVVTPVDTAPRAFQVMLPYVLMLMHISAVT